MEKAQETATEAETQRRRALRLEGEGRIVELEPVQGLAEIRVSIAVDRVKAAKDHGAAPAVTGQGRRRRVRSLGNGLPHPAVTDGLDAGVNITDLSGLENSGLFPFRSEDPNPRHLRFPARGHHANPHSAFQHAIDDPHVGDDPQIGVEVTVEDERLQRLIRVSRRRRNVLNHTLQDVGDAPAFLGAGQHALGNVDGQRLVHLLHDPVRVRRREVDLVDDRQDGQIVIHGQAHVGQGLSLDPLGGVHHQDGALAGRQAARHLIGEVDVARSVDEVQLVVETVRGLVGQSHRGHLDGDSPLPFQLHLVQDLFPHLPGIHGVGRLQQPVGQSRLPVVDVGDDAEVPDPGLGHGDTLRFSRGADRAARRHGSLL